MPQGLYAGTDGRLFKNLIAAQIQFSTPFSLNSLNPLQGLGNQIVPINIWLQPSYLPFLFFEEGAAATISMVLSWLALLVSSYFLSRQLGIGKTTSLIAAQLITVQFFPFQYELGLAINYLLNPAVAFTTAVVITLLGFAIRLSDDFSKGRRGTANMVMLFIVFLFGIITEPLGLFTIGLYFLPYFAVILVTSSWRTRWRILFFSTIVLVLLYFLGVIQYFHGLFGYTARTFAPNEVAGHLPVGQLISSILVDKSAPLYLFLGFGLAALLLLANRTQRAWGFCSLAYFVLLLITGVVFVVANTWTLPVPGYVEIAVMPIWIILATAGFALIFGWFWKRICGLLGKLGSQLPSFSCLERFQNALQINGKFYLIARFASILLVPLLVLFYQIELMPDRSTIYKEEAEKVNPPAELVEYLGQKYGLHEGGRFSGYVAELNKYGFISAGKSTPIWNALWRAKIPTVNEYSPLITPYSHFFFTRLAVGNQFGSMNQIPIVEPSGAVLEMLGVSAFVSDGQRDIPGYIFKQRYRSSNGYWDLYLYERPDSYTLLSPTHWKYKGSLKEIYDEIKSPSFNPQAEILVSEELDNQLIAARHSKLEVVRGGYRFSAVADGPSVVVLPIQFSNCLKAVGDSSKKIHLFRANGLLTGVRFDKLANFDLFFSLTIGDSECRNKDVNDLSLAVRGLPTRTFSIQTYAKIDMVDAAASIQRFWNTTSLAPRFLDWKSKLSYIPEHKFSGEQPACQSYAADTLRYTGITDLEEVGTTCCTKKDDAAFFQYPIDQTKVIQPSKPFVGFGWGKVETLNYADYRRIAPGHSEGLIVTRVTKSARYKVRIAFWKHVPGPVSQALTVSFNGIKAIPVSFGPEGDIGWIEYELPLDVTKACNGWVEILISTRGQTSRLPGRYDRDATGLYFLLRDITVSPSSRTVN